MSIRRLMPGLYIDDASGTLNVDCVEVCVAAGWDPTPENQDLAEKLVLDAYEHVVGAPPDEHIVHESRYPPRNQG